MTAEALSMIAVALLAAFTLMSIVWIISNRIHNAGIVDIAWSFCFAMIVSIYALFGSGWGPRRALIATMVILWSLRLTIHLYRRVMGAHPEEDGRYRQLRVDWAPNIERKFFFFFQLQALLDVVLSIPFLLPALNRAEGFHPLEWVGVGLWVVALAGESTADRQLARFKADPASHGKTCRVGLWRYSRHPNYFFEWLVWCAYFAFALGSPWGIVTIYAPLLMLYFLLRVTGIPMTEEHAVKSRGDDYREYQRTTSGFVPWFPKK